MSACMETSVGIQWLLQPARYFSHAQWYFSGSSWLTSARQLIIRLSSTRDAAAAAVDRAEAGGSDRVMGCARRRRRHADACGAAGSDQSSIGCSFVPAAHWHASQSGSSIRQAIAADRSGAVVAGP